MENMNNETYLRYLEMVQDDGKALIQKYYNDAPKIVKEINLRENHK